MGCSISRSVSIRHYDGDDDDNSRYWFRVRSEKEISSICETENTEYSMLELRALMDYPIGRQFIIDQKEEFAELCLNGWLDIQSFNAMLDGPTKITMAHAIHKKYISKNSIVTHMEQERIKSILKSSPERIVTGLFDEVKSQLFKNLHDNMFVDFRATEQYTKMCATLRRKYNRVAQNDFWYHQLIGQGGFGIVAEVSKKSTGIRYAMKLLRKDHLAIMFGDEPWRVDMEKRAFASCRHPFIVELHFAFQTESLVAMVMSLGTGRDLSKILSQGGPLTIEQVTFYAAEATSALSYLHDKGLVYRDLKPGNILLNMDGHIQLVDFGGICDVNGKLVANCKSTSLWSPMLVPSNEVEDSTPPPLSQFWSRQPRKKSSKKRPVLLVTTAVPTPASGSVPSSTFTAAAPASSLDADPDLIPTIASSAPVAIAAQSGDNASVNAPICEQTCGSLNLLVNSHVGTGTAAMGLGTTGTVATVASDSGAVSIPVQGAPLAPSWVKDKGDNNMLSLTSTHGPDYKRLKEKCKGNASDMHKLKQKFVELSDATLLRHFLVNNCHYDKTVANIEETLLWRQSYFTFTERPNHHSSGPGCFIYANGFDVKGHPLLVVTSRLLGNPKSNAPELNEMRKWVLYMIEVAIQRLPPHLEQFTVLVNRVKSSTAALAFGSYVGDLIRKRYPNRIYKIVYFPSSVALKAIGGVLKSMAGTNDIHFVDSLPVLREYIPKEYVPVEMGGTCNYEFNINDYPPPTVCEPYDYCLAHGLTSRVMDMNSPEQKTRKVYSSASSSSLMSVDHFAMSNNSQPQQSKNYNLDSLHAELQELQNEEMEKEPQRAHSIVGTYSYMAPEMVIILMDVEGLGFTHTGYTKAVDWWSLGVTIYRLLTGLYPFKSDIPKPTTAEERMTEGSDRYSALLEKVDYSMFSEKDADAVNLISQLLIVDDAERLGAGPDGSNAVSAHKFFADINWVELEQKKSKPPPVPSSCVPLKWRGQRDLDTLLRLYKKDGWLCPVARGGSDKNKGTTQLSNGKDGSEAPKEINTTLPKKSALEQAREKAMEIQLRNWDYSSPSAVLEELRQPSATSPGGLVSLDAAIPSPSAAVQQSLVK